MGLEYESIWGAMKGSHYKRTIEILTEEIGNANNSQDAIERALNRVVDAIHAEAGTFWFYDRFGDRRIHPEAVYGGSDLLDISLAPGEGIAGQVIEKRESTFIQDCQKDPRWAGKVDKKTGFITKSMICVPLEIHDLCFGSIQIINKTDGLYFDQVDLEFTEKLAKEVSKMLADNELLRGYVIHAGRELEDTITYEQIVYAPTKREMERILRQTNCYHLLDTAEKEEVVRLTEQLRLIFDKALERADRGEAVEEKGKGFFGRFKK